MRKWDDETILKEIWKLSDGEVGPAYNDASGMASTAARRFGSWPEAVRQAGLRPKGKGKYRDYIPEEVLEMIKARAVNGVMPKFMEHQDLRYLAKQHFGSWSKARQKAGLLTNNEKGVEGNSERTERARKFAAMLHIAHKHGSTDVWSCLQTTRKGGADGIEIKEAE